MVIDGNNKKMTNIVKEIVYLTIYSMLSNDKLFNFNSKEVMNDLAKKFTDVVVNNEIGDLIRKEVVDGSKDGLIKPKLTSIINTIDPELISEDTFVHKFPSIKKSVYENLVKLISGEILYYKETVLTDIRTISAFVKEDISNLMNKNHEEDFLFKILDDKYLYTLAGEKNILDEYVTVSDSMLDEFSLNLKSEDTATLFYEVPEMDLKTVIEDDTESNINMDDVLKYVNTLINLQTYSERVSMLRNAGIYDLDSLFYAILYMKNFYRKNKNNLSNGNKEALSNLLTFGSKRFKTLLKMLRSKTANNYLVLATSKTNEGKYLTVVCGPNYTKFTSENPDVTLNAFNGYAILSLANSMSTYNVNGIKINDFTSQVPMYRETYNTYMEMMALNDRNADKQSLIRIYAKNIRKVNEGIKSKFNLDVENELVLNTATLCNKLELSTLLEPINTLEVIYDYLVVPETNFGLFANSVKNVNKVIGEDVDPDKAALVATIDLLSKHLVSQLYIV